MIPEDAPTALWEGRAPEHWAAAWGIPALFVFRRTGSTNDIARGIAANGAVHGTTVLADEQTAGRGRHGRTWTAPPGSALLLSYIIVPRRHANTATTAIPIRVGLAVSRALQSVCGVDALLEWPNDVVLRDGGKVAGILCEGAIGGGGGFVVAGVGINVNQSPADFPPELRRHATSLLCVTGSAVSRSDLAGALLRELQAFGDRLDLPLEPQLLDEFARRDSLLGTPLLVDGEPLGRGAGLTEEGELRVDSGVRVITIRSATVRPAAAAERPRTGWTTANAAPEN